MNAPTHIGAVVAKEFRCSNVSSKDNIASCSIACFFDSFAEKFHSCFIGRKIRSKSAFVSNTC